VRFSCGHQPDLPLLGQNILKIAKLCAKDANFCAKIAKWVTGNVGDLGDLGELAVQKLPSRSNSAGAL
jgi:hypothetical protein